MDLQFALAISAVFTAATLQSATGIGFGVIAGPILLAIMNDALAVQISIVLNLLIALSLAPTVYRQFHRPIMPRLLIGLMIGSPLGIFLFAVMSLAYLKLLATAFVLFALTVLLYGERLIPGNSSRENSSGKESRKAPTTVEQVSIGAVAGIMGGSLGMPGPVPAAWMSARGLDKSTVRATILMLFVAAYGIAFLMQVVTTGIDRETLNQCLVLAMPTIGGILLGQQLSKRIAEQTFRIILTVVLVATAATLVASIQS